jgi:hypothetical protein
VTLRKERLFFFAKKKQKTFVHIGTWPIAPAFAIRPARQIDKSLFASFSSEKEESSFV